MIDINFSNVRSFGGSQNSGFEELVCQLAHLERPENARKFVRKEGAGGDAGVECYWILDDGREICWQAKYFIDGMNPSRWTQLDSSFKTALSKHPNLDTYVVCLPIDRTDSRKKGPGGNQVTSWEDKWHIHLTNWISLAKEQGCAINIEFWGKHEIATLLAIDDPHYSGRLLYWFSEPVLSTEGLRNIAQKSRDTLGDRFTPEFHVDLPIIEQFDGLCANKKWWSEISSLVSKLQEQYSRFALCISDEKFEDSIPINREGLEGKFVNFIAQLSGWIKSQYIDLSEIKVLSEAVFDSYRQIYEVAEKREFKRGEYSSNFQGVAADLDNQLREIDYFLKTKKTKAYSIGAALLHGEAGIGKSHLLCDLALHRSENDLPTIFLLGSQYGGGDPVDFVKQNLGLQQFSNRQVLGTIDSAGEAHRCKALIIIDAINEGPYRERWRNFLRGFITDISGFKNISLLISCRTTYCRYILPDSVDESCLVEIHHQGFQGFEHRAAEKYLSKQGISKPSAPILAPEFSNPLFLKTCCKALKDRRETSFPKGLHGLTQLFRFYLESIERTISIKKRYTSSEKIVHKSLLQFSSNIYPEQLSGIPIGEARTLINSFDIAPLQSGDSLFDLLLHEGILSEDMLYENDDGHPVIRYTYERFSDVLIAQQILDKQASNTVKSIFDEDEPLGKFFRDDELYRVAGILEALAIALAEKFGIELIDVLPTEEDFLVWQMDEIFINTVIWRSPASFSDRTLELLNKNIGNDDTHSPALDILLKLSTEPGHPWNAQLLHRNLITKEVAERDHFWSIKVALGDSSEEQGEESIVRTLIEWACFGELAQAEDERIRLCAITLFWFLTTSNRKVRDRATKSLVRLLSERPHLVEGIFNDFCDVDDLYLTERLYAVVYGVVCNIGDNTLVAHIAQLVFDKLFKNGEPIPHLLLRDYARGILELALKRSILPEAINPQLFRPRYKSPWPIENPSEDELDRIIDDEQRSRIKNSLMGFPGDFGNYTMNCVHDWSVTPLSESHIKTGYELKLEFAEKFLEGEVKADYRSFIEPEKREPVESKELVERLNGDKNYIRISEELIRQRHEDREAIVNKIDGYLGKEDQEYFRWLSGLINNQPAAFSRKWAQRWVCKRAYELGWKEELFSDFEGLSSHSRGGGSMERVGKKYQWIALHEFLARLSDNVHWIDRGYSDLEDSEYYGPWQMYKRDIDPTNWLRKSGEYRTYYNEHRTWWQPYRFPIEDLEDLDAQKAYLWNQEDVPDFSSLLITNFPGQNLDWYVLRGFCVQQQMKSNTDSKVPTLDCWFRINSIIVSEDDFEDLKEKLSRASLIDPHTVSVPSVIEGFLGEYPWHPVYNSLSNWQEQADSNFKELIPQRHFIPVSEYKWERGSVDHSIEDTLSFYLPAKELIDDLGMERVPDNFGSWQAGNHLVFLDPSVNEYGPSYALMRGNVLREWMAKNGLKIMWLIGGEKQLFSSDIAASDFFGRLVYNGVYWLENNCPVGDLHFKRERPAN